MINATSQGIDKRLIYLYPGSSWMLNRIIVNHGYMYILLDSNVQKLFCSVCEIDIPRSHNLLNHLMHDCGGIPGGIVSSDSGSLIKKQD